MKLTKAERKFSKIKILLQGASGSGKTFSSLLLAYGLCSDWNSIVVIDSENNSSNLYSNLGDYNVINIGNNHSPENYIKAIEMAEAEGMKVAIIDSLTHEWESILAEHSNMQGNSFTNWNKLSPRHNAFIQKMLSCNLHIISTTRVKQDFVIVEKDGKNVPERIGLKSIARNDTEYEFTLSFYLDNKNYAVSSKDRTGLFVEKPQFKINSNTGRLIKSWCETGTSVDQVKELIKSCTDLEKLRDIYRNYPSFKESLKDLFLHRSNQLKDLDHSNDLINLNKALSNGTTN